MRNKLCLLALLWMGLTPARSQTITNLVDAFNTNSYPSSSITNEWSNWFGAAFQSLALDPALDANTNAASGSMKIVANYPVATDQFTVWNGINGFNPGLNGFHYTNFQCSVRFASGSATNSSGRFGTLEFGVPTPSYGQHYFGSISISATNTNWVQVNIPINANANTNLQSITGLLIHIWGAGLVGPSTLWVDNIRFTGPSGTNAGTVTVSVTNRHQVLDGFGAATAFYQNWLTAHPYRNEIYTNMFTGLGLDILRLGNWFRYPSSTNFDNDSLQIVTNATRVRGEPIPILMSSWSPPASLKSNGQEGNGGTLATNASGGFVYTNFGNYWFDGIKAYRSNGIAPTWISIQNEPDFEAGWPTCKFLPNEGVQNGTNYASYALALAAVHQRITNLPAPPKILGPELAGISGSNLQNFCAALNSNHLYGVAHHLYSGGTPSAPDSFKTSMTAAKNVLPSKPKWQSEFSGGDGIQTAWLIHNSLTVEEVTAYLYWDLFWDKGGLVALEHPWTPASWTNAPPGTATQSKGYWLTPQYFAMKHFSYFTAPGYTRVAAAGTDTNNVLSSAFISPDNRRLTVMLINPNPYNPSTAALNWSGFQAATSAVYQTWGTNRFAFRGALTNAQIFLPPNSITTIVLDGSTLNIVAQPVSQTICPGTAATFSVVASPTNANYAWQFSTNGGAGWIPVGVTGTNASYTTLTNVVAGTQYRVAVSDGLVTNYSDSATLTFFSAPVIVQSPADQTVVPGGAAVFSLQAGGGGTLSYQWRRSGTNLVNGGGISGATNPTLTVSGLGYADNGSVFDCVVGNGCQFTNSAAATLTVTNTLLALRFDFEDSGATTTDLVHGVSLNLVNSSGIATDLHGASGSGVAGAGRGLNFTSSTSQGGTGPLAFTTNNTSFSFGSLSNYTLTLWFKPASALPYGVYPRLFIFGTNGTTDVFQNNGFSLLGNAHLNTNAAQPYFSAVQAYHNSAQTSTADFGSLPWSVNQWSFLALSYDGADWKLFRGSESQAAQLIGVQTNTPGGPLNLGGAFSLYLGNRSSNGRAFHGTLDDVRLYQGVLPVEMLETVRLSGGGSPPLVIGPGDAPLLFATAAGGQIMVHTTNSMPGVLYILESAPGLAPASWLPLVTNVGNGNALTNVLPVQSGANQFFRQRLSAP